MDLIAITTSKLVLRFKSGLNLELEQPGRYSSNSITISRHTKKNLATAPPGFEVVISKAVTLSTRNTPAGLKPIVDKADLHYFLYPFLGGTQGHFTHIPFLADLKYFITWTAFSSCTEEHFTDSLW